jgi:hypothetical protein
MDAYAQDKIYYMIDPNVIPPDPGPDPSNPVEI